MTKKTFVFLHLFVVAIIGMIVLVCCKKVEEDDDYSGVEKKPEVVVTEMDGAIQYKINKKITFVMLKVEGDTFTMGVSVSQDDDSESDERPVHTVVLSDFYIGETEVAQNLWQLVMGSNPSYFVDASLPVEQVSWNDCQKFIERLNDLIGSDFRLPTEAEWEYAARGGNKRHGYKFAGSNNIDDVAWFVDNSEDKTHPIKLKDSNELGIYDMCGNVSEWCNDWYGNYSSGIRIDPQGPTSGTNRVCRGGRWNSYAVGCRITARASLRPENKTRYIGLRLAKSVKHDTVSDGDN